MEVNEKLAIERHLTDVHQIWKPSHIKADCHLLKRKIQEEKEGDMCNIG